LVSAISLTASDFTAPARNRAAARNPGAESVLPGGRMITPIGREFTTGPGPFGIAVSPDGHKIVSANGGPNRYSLTILQNEHGSWSTRQMVAPLKREENGETEENDWHSVFMGLAFNGEHELYASEGESGRVRLIDPQTGKLQFVFSLNVGGYQDSYTGDLAFDRARAVLYVVDQANFRLVAIDMRKRRILASLRLGRLPFAIALSADGRKAYVTNIGMFEYRPVPGATQKEALRTGLPFPAFGFPSTDAYDGADRDTAAGSVHVPGLGDPNVPESNSLAVIDVNNPAAPKLETFIRTGLPFGKESMGGSSPSGVAVGGGHVFVSNGNNDSISVVDAVTNRVLPEIAIRIPGLKTLRGVLPIGLAWSGETSSLLVAEAGINAVGVIDTREMRVLGHIPAAWFPTRPATKAGMVYLVNAKGHGTGPNSSPELRETFQGSFRRGSISVFPLPARTELAALTERVMRNNGFLPASAAAPPLPGAIHHVVLIVKENRTFDEMFGDMTSAANGPVASDPSLARFGLQATVTPDRRFAPKLPVLKGIDVSPNHHQLATRYAFSDNFYADSEVSVDGHHWLVGSYPNAWTESSLMAAYGGEKEFRLPTSAPGRLSFAQSNSSVHPEELLEAGTIWHHFQRHGISFRNYGEGFELAGVEEEPGMKPTGARYVTNVPMPEPLYLNTARDYPQFNTNIPDQYRASQFIAEMERKYVNGGEPLPQFLYIHLPQDHTARVRPADGYPYMASYIADNDYALGRIVEFLSHTRWWPEMAVFVTEDDSQSGVDHVDSHRTVLLVASPFVRRNYASHVNTSFPGMLKTIFRLLGIPPLNLFDAAAADLADCFGGEPDFRPYQLLPIDPAVFDPAKVQDPLDPVPDSPKMDDPRFIREQHDQRQRNKPRQ